jgi:hypothetical protein
VTPSFDVRLYTLQGMADYWWFSQAIHSMRQLIRCVHLAAVSRSWLAEKVP